MLSLYDYPEFNSAMQQNPLGHVARTSINAGLELHSAALQLAVIISFEGV
jgi:hypothetical protein